MANRHKFPSRLRPMKTLTVRKTEMPQIIEVAFKMSELRKLNHTIYH